MILASDALLIWWLTVPTALAYLLTGAVGPRVSHLQGHRLAWGPWLLHGLGLVYAMAAPQDGAVRFGFAPALSVTVWVALTFYLLEQHWFPQLRMRWALMLVAAVTVVLAALFPGAPLAAHASAWLPVHFALGVASYGLFGAAVAHAWLMRRAEKHIRQAADNSVGLPLLTLERLTFRFADAGFVLLTATLAAGWLFGETLYGSAWQWSHKTVFSTLAWLVFAALLMGRRQFGWRGRTAVRVLYTGAVLLLLAYVGSRFVLEVILGRGT